MALDALKPVAPETPPEKEQQPPTKRAKVTGMVETLLNPEIWKTVVENNTRDRDATIRRKILGLDDTMYCLTGRRAATAAAIDHFTTIVLHHINREEGG